jgi:adenosylcobinamide-phosphate synthase
MAAAAWLLSAPGGGPAVYFGTVKDKPVRGPKDGGTWDDGRLKRLSRLAAVSGIGGAVLMQCYFYPLLHGLP